MPALDAPLTLVVLPEAFGLRSPSSFCLKIEQLMTQLKLPFELELEIDPRKAPKGKMPFLRIGSEVLADSELIAQYLDQRTDGGVFGDLSAQQLGHGWAATRLAEEHLYWLMVASRWLDDAWWPNVVEGFFATVPGVVRGLIAKMARRQVVQTLHLHGLGRHELSDQHTFARRDLAALQGCVSSDGFLCGASPTYFDFAVASVLASIADNKPETWLTQIVLEYPALGEYTERVQSHVGVYGRA